jgi:hypothetical protein
MTNIKLLVIAIGLTGFLSSCQLDNYEGPNAALSGSVIDAETGELVEQDIIRGTNIQLTEHGYDPVSPQFLIVKNDGTYANDMLFANTYTVQPVRGNFIPLAAQDVEIKGGTKLDFTVTPYIRIEDLNIVREGDKVIATFRVKQNVANNVRKVGLYAHADPHVGETMRLVAAENNLNAVVDSNQVFTLELDLAANNSILVSGKPYFFRVGALIDVGEAKLNYAPAVRIDL